MKKYRYGIQFPKKPSCSLSQDEVYRKVYAQFKKQWKLIWQKPLGFNNTYAIAMRREDALKRGIETISDLAIYKEKLLPGFNHEFLRNDRMAIQAFLNIMVSNLKILPKRWIRASCIVPLQIKNSM